MRSMTSEISKTSSYVEGRFVIHPPVVFSPQRHRGHSEPPEGKKFVGALLVGKRNLDRQPIPRNNRFGKYCLRLREQLGCVSRVTWADVGEDEATHSRVCRDASCLR